MKRMAASAEIFPAEAAFFPSGAKNLSVEKCGMFSDREGYLHIIKITLGLLQLDSAGLSYVAVDNGAIRDVIVNNSNLTLSGIPHICPHR